jgi:hypothetical protein
MKKFFAAEWLVFMKYGLLPWIFSAVLFFGYDQYQWHNNIHVSLSSLYKNFPVYKESVEKKEFTQDELKNAVLMAYLSNDEDYQKDARSRSIISHRANHEVFENSIKWLTYGVLEKIVFYLSLALILVYPIAQIVRLTKWAVIVNKSSNPN